MTMRTHELLKTSPLFQGFNDEEMENFLSDTLSYTRTFCKGEEIYPFNQEIHCGGFILSGEVNIQTDAGDNKGGIVGKSYPGELIGHAFHIAGQTNDVAHFIAGCDDTDVLFSDFNCILCNQCKNNSYICFLENLIRYLSNTNITLNRKMEILNQKTLRDKLLICFSQMADKYGSSSFTIPFNRDQLAQYIGSERSSVCRELGKMQDEGLIRLNGNHIILLFRK